MTLKNPRLRHASLLIVDESPDSTEVLRTIFELRGVSILEAGEVDQGLASMRLHNPDVVILDLEMEEESAGRQRIQQAFESASRERDATLVVLGKASQPTGLPDDHVVAKPYHYGPLVRTIERILNQRALRGRAA